MAGFRTHWRRSALTLAALGLAFLAGLGPACAQTAAEAIRDRVIPFTRADVVSNDGRTFVVAWAAPPTAGAVAVFARDEGDHTTRRVGRGGPSGEITVSHLAPADRWWFELRPRHGAALTIADRSLHLASAPNFRDVGGYRTRDGQWVRMGVAYRSDQLDRLSPEDLAVIARLAPGLVVDLRTDAERRSGPDRLPSGVASLVADVMADSPPTTAAILRGPGPDAGIRFLTEANRQFVSTGSAKRAYASLFSRLPSAADNRPIVYHCTAGKDRTGWASAVLLTALGVPRETVMEDYLASNRYLAVKNQAIFASMPAETASKLEPVMTVRSDYLEAAFAEVEQRYGSFDRYLREGLGIDDAAIVALRRRFLAGAPAP